MHAADGGGGSTGGRAATDGEGEPLGAARLFGRLARRGSEGGAALDERRALGRGAREDCSLMTRRHQMAAHVTAHHADADPCDSFRRHYYGIGSQRYKEDRVAAHTTHHAQEGGGGRDTPTTKAPGGGQ